MKKILVIILALMMLLSISACGYKERKLTPESNIQLSTPDNIPPQPFSVENVDEILSVVKIDGYYEVAKKKEVPRLQSLTDEEHEAYRTMVNDIRNKSIVPVPDDSFAIDKIFLFPRATYEDVGIRYNTNKNGKQYFIMFYYPDDVLSENVTDITEYWGKRYGNKIENLPDVKEILVEFNGNKYKAIRYDYGGQKLQTNIAFFAEGFEIQIGCEKKNEGTLPNIAKNMNVIWRSVDDFSPEKSE